jgi:hypothetical protein
MKKTAIFANILMSVVVSTSAVAFAEDHFTTEKWSEDFAASLKSKSSVTTKKLTDFEALEKKLFSKCSECEDKKKMEKARKIFAKGKYEEARSLYNEVKKSSSYWLEAVEERAWTYFRESNFDDALAQSKTLLAPQFASYVGSEAYFLQALTSLKTCNYKSVFETNKNFKEKQKERLVEIQALSTTGMNEAFKNVLSKTETFPMVFSELGENVKHLPQLFYKDLELQKQLMRYKLAMIGLDSLASKESGDYSSLSQKLETTRTKSLEALKSRMKKLAAEETEDNFKIVQKLNLVEVEAIQRLHADLDMDKNLFVKGDYKKTTADNLVFLDDGRPWIDELDKYEVRAKTCPQNIRRKM